MPELSSKLSMLGLKGNTNVFCVVDIPEPIKLSCACGAPNEAGAYAFFVLQMRAQRVG